MEILRCEKVSRIYGFGDSQVKALDGIDLSVEAGEFIAVMGPSGSGKSTLLHLLGSVDRPTEGKILVEGQDISRMNPAQAALFRRRKAGIVYQFYNLIPTLTAEKNILLPLALDKRKPDPDFFRKVTDALGIRHKLDALPGQLSGGQQQRTAIARALICRPAILLADEPTGNLDPHNAMEIMGLLEEINRQGTTVVVVTHSSEIVNMMRKRVITIQRGIVVGDEKESGYWYED